MSSTRVIVWDWKDQPDWHEFARALDEVSGGTVHLREVETGSDDFAVVLSRGPIDEQDAADVFDAWLAGDDEPEPPVVTVRTVLDAPEVTR